ncbi:MAG: YicC/YloC family endoribonuclease [Bacteroidales bacterium]|nr:YicC/YloC family endoribonuclease [Bacteroidales bacterium]
MIQSMTGFGKASCEISGKKITVEIKSLNSKQLDLSTRIPNAYKDREMEIRNEILNRMERGKVDFSLYFENTNKDNAPQLNFSIVESFFSQLNETAGKLGIAPPADPWPLFLRLPDALKTEVQEIDDETWIIIQPAVSQAIDQLVQFRIQEGKMLESVFTEKLDRIESLLKDIEVYEPERVEKIKARIADGLEKIKGVEYDKNRFEQEMIFYIEKLDINEEKSRLANHCKYFRETMAEAHGQGKKLGFICQEIGREVNTMGSKSNHSDMQKTVVCMKDELEQMKEQVLNVL